MNHKQFIERIHAAATPLVLSITGGGSGAIAALLEVPGASATVLEAVVPYSSTALQQWLGGPVDHYCSERTARAMAMAAFERARRLSAADPHSLLGIGATASLVSNPPKRGPHRIHVAWQSAETTSVVSCELPKGARTRAEEEQIATELILNVVAEACDIPQRLPCEDADLVFNRHERRAPAAWTELLLGQRPHVSIPAERADANNRAPILFPGAFNPMHAAHTCMAEIAAKRLNQPVTFELSITNVDKPPLDFVEIASRLEQLVGRHVLLTRASRFVEKAQLAPDCTFVVGVDTIVRIGDAKYYGGGVAERDAAIAEIARAGCRFLVFGRNAQDTFQTLSDVEVPTNLRPLCDEVPESEFREDVSSTKLRVAP
jgi:nicotinamide mononucleotide (NMN) deamidase PncC